MIVTISNSKIRSNMLEELISKYLNDDSTIPQPDTIELKAFVVELNNGGRLHYLYVPDTKERKEYK